MGRSLGSSRPGMEIFHDYDRVSIFDIVEMFDLRFRQFTHDRHAGPGGNGRRIEKLLLDREEPPLGLLTIEYRSFTLVKRQLQQLDLGAVLQSLRLQHLAAEYHDLALV